MNKKLISLLAVALTGFIAAMLFEKALADQIQTGQFPSFFSFFPGLNERILALDKQEIAPIISQLKYRWFILVFFAGWMFFFPAINPTSTPMINRALWILRLFLVLQLLYLPDLAKELQVRSQWANLYVGLPLWKGLFPKFLPEYFHQWAVLLLFGLGAFSILKKWPIHSRYWIAIISVTLLIWTILLIQFFGFGKIDHTYSSLYMGLGGLLVWILLVQKSDDNFAFGFRLFQAFIWSCYFFAGLEKLLFSGLDWPTMDHFQRIYFHHSTPVGAWLIHHPFIVVSMLWLGLGYQLLSPLQWRFPAWGYVNATGAIFFHLGTWLIFGVGSWQSPWILTAIFLLPLWEKGTFQSKKNEQLA